MKRKPLYIFLFVILFVKINYAQTTFEKEYLVDINNEFGYISQLTILPDSGYLFSTTAYNNNNNFLLLGRLDKFGNTVWIKQIDDNNQISQANIAFSTNNLIYLTYSTANSTYNYSIVTKFDLSGNLIWSKSFGQNGSSQYSEHIFITSTSIYFAGEVSASNYYDLYITKLDISGNFIWQKTFDAGGTDYLRDAKQLKNGNILLGGLTTDSLSRQYASLFRVDTNGLIVWHKRFHIPSYKEFNPQAITENSDRDLIISGHVDSISPVIGFGKWDICLMKLSSTGMFKWAKIYGGANNDEAWEVIPTNDKGYIFAAEPESFGNISRISLLKTDSTGNPTWMRLYGKKTGGFPNNIVINPDKGYSIFANDGNYGNPAPIVFIKTDSLGISSCADSIVVLPQNSFIPISDSIARTGNLNGVATFIPIVTNYPLQATDYCNESASVTFLSNDLNVTIFPNPFSSNIAISIQKQNMKQASVKIYNFIGQPVFTHNAADISGSYFNSVDLAMQPCGLYTIEIIIDGMRTVHRIIKE